MAKVIVNVVPTDFAAFKKQKEAVQQEANKAIAIKIALVQQTLKEIQEIAEATDIQVDYYPLTCALSGAREASDDRWNSSSDNC